MVKGALHTLRVFTDTNGKGGDPLTVVFDVKQALNETKRMALAKEFGGAETAFIDSTEPACVSLYNQPTGRVAFAGQPLVGVASLLCELTEQTEQIIPCDAGEVRTWQRGKLPGSQKTPLVFRGGSLSNLPLWRISTRLKLPRRQAGFIRLYGLGK